MDINDTSYVFRLPPGADLKKSIIDFTKGKNIQAGWIVGCVGSLTQYAIRFANQQKIAVKNGYFEIVGLTGTISTNGFHLHIIIADDTGITTGGHLAEGCLIYTTAEIVLTASSQYVFTREKDEQTSWEELKISKK